MSVWMELRCEHMAHSRVSFWQEGHHYRCWSTVNEGPKLSANETLRGVSAGYRELERQAKKTGWVIVRKPLLVADGNTITGWVCPHCATFELGLKKPVPTEK